GEQDPRLAPAPTGGSKRRLQRLGHLAQLRAARLELLRHGLQPLRILLFGHAQRKARRLGLLLLQLPQIRHGGILRRYRENRAALGAEASVRLGENETGARGQRHSLAVRWRTAIPSRATRFPTGGNWRSSCYRSIRGGPGWHCGSVTRSTARGSCASMSISSTAPGTSSSP